MENLEIKNMGIDPKYFEGETSITVVPNEKAEVEHYDLDVLYSRENDECIIPTKRDEDAGYDLYVDPIWLKDNHDSVMVIGAHKTCAFDTGLRTVLPITHYAQIEERGSTGIRAMKFGAGVIDSGYRDTWNVIINNCNDVPVVVYNPSVSHAKATAEKHKEDGAIIYPISKGLAQFIFKRVFKARLKEISADEIMSYKSERGKGKLGSTD